jgi:hypothetical protein
LLLLSSNFDSGWPLYEWRWKNEKCDSFKEKREFIKPLWLGKEDLKGKTIFLHSEQGLGDTIQFCRYAKLVNELGAKVILEVQKPLLHLMTTLTGVHQLVTKGDKLPEFDFHCPMLSLPLAFKTSIQTIPAQVPYLSIDIQRVEKWKNYLGETGFKIAISWQGSTGKVDEGRSFPVSLFEEISKIEGVRLISLQKNAGTEQLSNLPEGMKVEHLPNDFDVAENSFLDSAAIMKNVDLVISSDTALTHLAGALGVTTWLPLKFIPDWRWLLTRTDSPWYPMHSIYRQKEVNNWQSVFQEMKNNLLIER